MRPVALHVLPPATTIILSPDGTARPSLVWKAASAPRGHCCTVCCWGEDGKTGWRPQCCLGLLCSESPALCSQEEPAWSWLLVPVNGGAASSHQELCCKRTVETGE